MESRTTVEHVVRPWGRNSSDCEIVVTRTYGLKTYIEDGKEVKTDWETSIDGGEKLGCARCRTLHPAVEPTPEERENNRKQQQAAVNEMYRSLGIW